MKNYFDQTVQLYKLCCDGYDFVNRIEAFEYSEMEIQYANRHCIINNFDKLNEFYKYSIQERKKTNIECNDYIGIAGRTLFKNNILWYHNFGKNITEDVIPRNVLCTYDSQDHTNLNFKKLESICNKIKELKNEKRN